MKRTIFVVLAASLPLTLCVPVLQAQSPGPDAAKSASQMPESGPSVVGGTGATLGPNSKNQAVMPMPGLRQDEELSVLPRTSTITVPEVRPATTPPPARR